MLKFRSLSLGSSPIWKRVVEANAYATDDTDNHSDVVNEDLRRVFTAHENN